MAGLEGLKGYLERHEAVQEAVLDSIAGAVWTTPGEDTELDGDTLARTEAQGLEKGRRAMVLELIASRNHLQPCECRGCILVDALRSDDEDDNLLGLVEHAVTFD